MSLRTPFTELFAIEIPVLQAAIWPATSAELIAAVGEAGAIGSIGAIFTTSDALLAQVARVRELTDRPFVVNQVVPSLDEDMFAATLTARRHGRSTSWAHVGRARTPARPRVERRVLPRDAAPAPALAAAAPGTAPARAAAARQSARQLAW